MSIRSRTIATAAMTMALVVPAAAQAATTKQVYMGEPVPQQNAFNNNGADVDNFFPQTISVHVGDSVRFIPAGFHTVDLPGKGQKGQAIIGLTGANVAGEADAAGAPFWFNGLPQLGLNKALLAGSLGRKVSYSGATRVDSGLPLANKPKPMVVKFTKRGSFTYFCDVHAGMKGTVKVVANSKSLLSAKAETARVAKQVASDLKIAKGLAAATKVPANTISAGAVGGHGVELLAFVPAKLTVPVGTTVTFRMATGSVEVHTATTGPGDPLKAPTSYLGVIAAGMASPVFPGAGVYPSEIPGGPLAALTPLLHGNGFWNAGAMDSSAATTIVPPSGAVTVAAPGQYEFYCMIHPFMHATVVAQ